MSDASTIWAFDLGKGSIGEAVRRGTKFLHKESLLIPPDFAETKSAAGRRRMWRTRQAHKAREQWLDEVMRAAGIEPLKGRQVGTVDGKWIETAKGDPRLEREFASSGDPTCYTSCLLRIKLLRGEKLEPWQVYKALHSAIQRRGYDPDIPWKNREQRRAKSSDANDDEAGTQHRMQQFEKDLEAMCPGKPEYQFPCYFDAWKMGLWNPSKPVEVKYRIDCRAESTRNQIVPRWLVDNEIVRLVEAADKLFHGKLEQARVSLLETFKRERIKRIEDVNERRKVRNASLPVEKRLAFRPLPTFQHLAESAAEYMLFGPAGRPPEEAKVDFARYLAFRRQAGLHPGSSDDWQGVVGQKIPRFDNRILNDCALIPRLHVCRNPSPDEYKKLPDEKLLPAQVTFLMKLKNMRVEEKTRERKQRGLKAEQIKEIFEEYNPKRKYNLTSTQWRNWCERFDVRPITDAGERGTVTTDETGKAKKKEEKNSVEAPTAGGRCRFSRPALKVLKTLILSGLKPSHLHKKLVERDAALLAELGIDILNSPPIEEKKDKDGNVYETFTKQPRPWLLVSDLSFLLAMRKAGAKEDSWEDLFIPNQRLDQVVQEITAAGQGGDAKAERQLRDKAIQELIGSQNDPKVRHRLATFWERLKLLETLPDKDGKPIGVPDQIVLEFIREDFMGQKAKDKLKKFQDDRAARRKEAKEFGGLNFELWKAQGAVCLYTGQALPQPNMPGWDSLVIDHIVPREAPYNGPDAMVNYALTTPETNAAKAKRTPFDWFQQNPPVPWDGYKNFVTAKIGALGGKKVQLLTRADAAELVEKYTSLAETAWISKLAQTLIRLHFGWPLDHERGRERITVVPGGLTGRIRRKYLLNTLLDERYNNLPTAQVKPEDEEEAEKVDKDRKDPRHHGLDAMLISFFPDWMRNPQKDDFFRFPPPLDAPFPGKRNKHTVREFFRKQLDEVFPENLFLEKAKLAEMAYGRSFQPEEKSATATAVKYKTARMPLTELAFRQDTGSARIYGYKQACRMVHGIVDENLRGKVTAFLKTKPTETDWLEFCQKLESEIGDKKQRGTPAKIEVRNVEEIRTRRKSVKDFAYEQGNSREYDVEYARENVNEIVDDSPEQQLIKSKLREFFAGNPTEAQWRSFAESLKPIDRCKLRAADEGGKKSKARTVKFAVFAHRPVPMKFNLKKAHARIDKVCDERIRQRLRAFANQDPPPDQTAWNAFCNSFAHERKDANGNLLTDATGNTVYGASIKKVRLYDGDPAEYRDFSKDGTGAFYKNKKEHKGQFVYLVDDGTPDGAVNVQPVYVFESVYRVKAIVLAVPKLKRLVGYFQSGCTIGITKPIPVDLFKMVIQTEEEKKKKRIAAASPLAPSKFLLKTIITASQAIEAMTADGRTVVSKLDSMVKAGLYRVR